MSDVTLVAVTSTGSQYTLFSDGLLNVNRRSDAPPSNVPDMAVYRDVTLDGMTPRMGLRFRLDDGTVISTSPLKGTTV